MKVIKPQKLALLTRPFEQQQQFHLGVAILAFFPLGDARSLFSEVSMWKFAAEQLGKDMALDAAIPKSRAEFLVSAKAFAPAGKPCPSVQVRACMDRLQKSLIVFGNRYWKDNFLPSQPEPFLEMPIIWENAFGGPGFAQNPLGKGIKPTSRNGQSVLHPLPNVEFLNKSITSPKQKLEPAGFGPYDLTWPQRFAHIGTYNQAWLEKDFPGFARDLDWRFFNLAPSDQQQEQPFRGDEKFILENMHPQKPRLEGHLPGVKMRCFINQDSKSIASLLEIPTRLTTVWLFPHEERGILIFHGSTKVAEDDAADIQQIIIGCEGLEESKPFEHYLEVLKKRLDKDKGAIYALREQDLLPSNISAKTDELADFEKLVQSEQLMRKNMRKKAELEHQKARERIIAMGLDPEEYAPPPPPPEEELPPLEELPEYAEKLKAEAEQKKAEAEQKMAEKKQEMRTYCEAQGIDFDQLVSDKVPTGPPPFSAQKQLEKVQELAAQARSQGVVLTDLEKMIHDPKYQQQLVQQEAQIREAYRFTAHHQEQAPRLQGEESQRVRAEIIAALAAGENFAGRDLTGADLSGLDLQGVNFEGAMLESANLCQAKLENANFTKAVLARSDLSQTEFKNTCFEDANLGGANLQRVRTNGIINFKNAILAKADLSDASLCEADFEQADLAEVKFQNTDLSKSTAENLILLKSDLQGAKLSGVSFKKCNFLEVNVSRVNFVEATLESCVFLKSQGDGANFYKAKLNNLRFVDNCSFAKANFRGTTLDNANLRGSILDESDFSFASLRSADFSECSLKKANFYQATAIEARFAKANLEQAVMTSINLMNSISQKANLRGADLRGANLFQADFARVHTDQNTKLYDANQTKLRVLPRSNS